MPEHASVRNFPISQMAQFLAIEIISWASRHPKDVHFVRVF